jgi:hypothetical protein
MVLTRKAMLSHFDDKLMSRRALGLYSDASHSEVSR